MTFPEAARRSLADTQLRANLARATTTIRDKRARVVAELPDWEELRAAGAQAKDRALVRLDTELERLEASVSAAGGQVHWARDGVAACEIIAGIARSHGFRELVKVKSIASDEIKLNAALAEAGVSAVETDIAELIIQLGHDLQSHILVPAIHKNRAEIRDLFRSELGLPDLSDEPAARPRGSTCARSSSGHGWGSAALTSPSPRPARCAWWSPRATGGCARRCRMCS